MSSALRRTRRRRQTTVVTTVRRAAVQRRQTTTTQWRLRRRRTSAACRRSSHTSSQSELYSPPCSYLPPSTPISTSGPTTAVRHLLMFIGSLILAILQYRGPDIYSVEFLGILFMENFLMEIPRGQNKKTACRLHGIPVKYSIELPIPWKTFYVILRGPKDTNIPW